MSSSLSLQKLLIAASVVLSVGFLVQFGLSAYEQATWPVNEPGKINFAVDAAPQYSVGLYHGLWSFILLALIFAKRYIAALSVSVSYLILHAYGTSTRLCTGFLGGDLCPEGPISWWAISRASWFDWLSTFLLLVIIILTVMLVVRNLRSTLD